MKRPFFETTLEALNAITSIYDFLWPTAASLWNLRWQVAGYYHARPAASVPELQARFIEGSGIHGANLKRACIDTSWEQQQAVLAGILLTNLFAIYEGWAERTMRFFGNCDHLLDRYESLGRLRTLQSPRSELLDKTVYPVLTASPEYDINRLDNYLMTYRFFKAIRNKQLHAHGIADDKSEAAYKKFSGIATPAGLGVTEVPEHFPVLTGQPVKITLRGVVGFSSLLRRMLHTMDAELARAKSAEPALDEIWLRHRPSTTLFKSDRPQRHRQISKVFKKIGFSDVNITDDIELALIARGLVRHR